MVGIQVTGKRLGIIGMGRVGYVTARRARGFDMEIHYSDVRRLPSDREAGAIYHETTEDLLPHCDFLALHCPATPETRHLLNAERIALLPDGAIVVNAARGSIVDETALIDALKSGKLAAAGLDVYEREPPPADSPLRGMENVVLTPHTASYSDYAFRLLSRRVAQSAVHVLGGHWPRFVANKGILDKLDLKPCPDPP